LIALGEGVALPTIGDRNQIARPASSDTVIGLRGYSGLPPRLGPTGLALKLRVVGRDSPPKWTTRQFADQIGAF
jgi:hypothetical protein